MLVQLGVTYQPHRAHLVCGLLDSYGVVASVWHEQACFLWVPSVFHKCSVVVDDEDLDDAREILAARPEVEVEDVDARSTDVLEVPDSIPNFLTLWLTGTLLSVVVGASSAALTFLLLFTKGQRGLNRPVVFDEMFNPTKLIVLSPVFGLAWAVCLALLLLPLRWMYRRPLMGLVSYLLPRIVYPVIFIVGLQFFDAVLHSLNKSGIHLHSLFSP